MQHVGECFSHTQPPKPIGDLAERRLLSDLETLIRIIVLSMSHVSDRSDPETKMSIEHDLAAYMLAVHIGSQRDSAIISTFIA